MLDNIGMSQKVIREKTFLFLYQLIFPLFDTKHSRVSVS